VLGWVGLAALVLAWVGVAVASTHPDGIWKLAGRRDCLTRQSIAGGPAGRLSIGFVAVGVLAQGGRRARRAGVDFMARACFVASYWRGREARKCTTSVLTGPLEPRGERDTLSGCARQDHGRAGISDRAGDGAPHFPAVGLCYFAILAAVIIAARCRILTALARARWLLPFTLVLPRSAWRRAARGHNSGGGKSYLSALAVLVLLSTTPLPELLHGLEHLGAARYLLMVVQFLYRYLFRDLGEAQHMRAAAAGEERLG